MKTASRVLILDNYDSFTYNLVHLVEQILHQKPDVHLNDQISLEKINTYQQIILSPGPGLPEQAGILKSLIREFAATKSILGVCLGHQAIGEVFGIPLVNLSSVHHGVAETIHITDQNSRIFKGLEPRQTVGRYHSWVLDKNQMIPDFMVTAIDDHEEVMAIQHRQYDLCGVQFHPESIMTPNGSLMLRNWLQRPDVL